MAVPFLVTIVCWFAFEAGLLVRDLVRRKARTARDRGTRLVVALSLELPIAGALIVHGVAPALAAPAPRAWAGVGLVVLWTGLAVRVWAVLALGTAFSTFVQVDAEQAIVTRGPYRWVRHPSYTGLLLIALGFGIGAGNWLALLICAVVPPVGVLRRIRVEEGELVRVLGEPYRRYRSRTRRLVPGLW